MDVSLGIDFGTTNSVAAVAHPGRKPEVAAAGPSCILIESGPTGQRLLVGEEALQRYLHTTLPARFVKSIKTILPDKGFHTTRVFGRPYAPENLVRPILADLKARTEALLGEPVDSVTLGRPVLFSDDDEAADALAERRMERAARLAGFEAVRFEREPIAAAWAYATGLDAENVVLVADLGGGTTDMTAIILRPGGTHDVLATGGAHIGGDDFDGYIMWGKLVRLFGHGTRYESWGKMLEVPPHIYRALCRWDRIPFLKDSRTRRDIRYMLTGAEDRPALERLRTLIDQDLGWALFRAIGQAKHELSERRQSRVSFQGGGISVDEPIGRAEFEQMLETDVGRIVAVARDTLARAGLTPQDVDVCFLTGGTSLIPAVAAALGDLLGAHRLRSGETFTSVATGLALRGLSDAP